MAWAANEGGALPSNEGDKAHTIRLLVEQGMSRATIMKRVSETVGLPQNYVGRIVDRVKAGISKEKLKLARTDVVSGQFTIPQAAERHGVDPQSLTSLINGSEVHDSRRSGNIMKAVNHCALSVGKQLQKIFQDVEDGTMSREDARTCLDAYDRGLASMRIKLGTWEKRFGIGLKVPSA